MVRNLDRNIMPADLREAAERYGKVVDIYLPRDRYNGWVRRQQTQQSSGWDRTCLWAAWCACAQ